MNNTETLKWLRQAGYRVFISHKRPDVFENIVTRYGCKEKNGKVGEYLQKKGGVTTVAIYRGDDLVSEGVAYCSRLDNFDKRRGLGIALGRAIKEL